MLFRSPVSVSGRRNAGRNAGGKLRNVRRRKGKTGISCKKDFKNRKGYGIMIHSKTTKEEKK